jgi:hypothetical protein
MNRTDLINQNLQSFTNPRYVEIGVRNGENFFSIKSKNKVGVDPEYFFSKRFFLKSLMKYYNWRFTMFRKTSDSFFEHDAPYIYKSKKIDVVFIDGMHTYTQSLKDAKNSLRFLNDNGVIIFHDCNPQTPEAATHHLPSKKINWNGDVWKTIHHFRQLDEFFDCFTMDADEGLGVLKMRKGTSPQLVPKLVPLPSLEKLSFDDLKKNRDEFLGLR